MEDALSHFDTDCLDTPSCPASSSWDQPFFFLNSAILSAKIIYFPSCICLLLICSYAQYVSVVLS